MHIYKFKRSFTFKGISMELKAYQFLALFLEEQSIIT